MILGDTSYNKIERFAFPNGSFSALKRSSDTICMGFQQLMGGSWASYEFCITADHVIDKTCLRFAT